MIRYIFWTSWIQNGNIIYSSVNEGLVKFSDGKRSSLYNPENGFLFEVPMSSYVFLRLLRNTSDKKKEIGFCSEIDITEGIARTIDWTKSNIDLIESNISKHQEKLSIKV